LKIIIGKKKKVSVKTDSQQEKSDKKGIETDAINSHLKRQAITDLAAVSGGKVVDVSLSHCTIELCAESDKIDAFIHMLKPFGIIEAVRSGVMAIAKSSMDSIHSVESEEESNHLEHQAVDETQLPPG